MGYKLNKAMEIFEVPQGLILPRKNAKGAPMWGLGGVCGAEGSFFDASFYDGGWAKHGGIYEWHEEAYIDAPAVYIGMFYSHWGHFLIDLTNRFWALAELHEKHPNIKVAYLGEEKISGNNLEFFKLLGFDEKDFYQVTVPTRFSKVYVPEQGFKSCEFYSEEHVNMFDLVVTRALEDISVPEYLKNVKKVYFTRRSFVKAQNSEFGEVYFEQVFKDSGFAILSPEKLSLREQIYVWNNAEEIACVNGSIPLNAVFCNNPGIKLTVLNKTSIIHENPMILFAMRGVDAVFLDVYEEPYKRYPKSLGEGPFLMMPNDLFHSFCANQGLTVNDSVKDLPASERKKYIKYVFDIKRRLKILAIKIVYKLKLKG